MLKRRSWFAIIPVMLPCLFSCLLIANAEEPTVQKIWDAAPHNAFTDLAYWHGEIYCAFREGSGHVPGTSGVDGTSRIIASEDGEAWRSVGLIAADEIDLRDPKLSVTPDDRLMVVMGGSYYDGTTLLKRVPQVAFLDEPGGEFSEPEPAIIDPAIATSTDWLWRVAWHKGVAYGVVYQPNPDAWGLQLVSSKDGIHFDHVATLDLEGRPNETTVRFDPDGTMRLIVRNEESGNRGHYGTSESPYTDWNWTDVPHRLGGPNIVRLESGEWLLGTRCYDPPGATTILERLSDNGRVDRILDLPSGGDTSYPGMILIDDVLWFSYYSSHEGRTSIYLAKINVSWIEDALQRLDAAEAP